MTWMDNLPAKICVGEANNFLELAKIHIKTRYFLLLVTDVQHVLEQGFSNGALGPSWGPRSGSPGATNKDLH